MKATEKLFTISLTSYFIFLVLFAIFSYGLTAPNLILSQNESFWRFQSLMWETFFNNRPLLIQVYSVLLGGLFLSFFGLLIALGKKWAWKKFFLVFFLLIIPLLFSSTSLSYDVFNYIFNAKIAIVYGENPHIQTATDFPDDEWTRFMHNVHTPAPYGYGWTLLSFIPFYLGFGKFLLTWFTFRLFSLFALVVLLSTFWLNKKQTNKELLSLLFLNPLILIEVVTNAHNDFWMMMPAVAGLLLLDSASGKKSDKAFIFFIKMVISLSLLVISIYVKLASIVLLPIWLLLLFKNPLSSIPRFDSTVKNWPLLASIFMFVPLLTLRSQQFHPWYLIWSLAFIPLFTMNKISKLWVSCLLIFSVSSMFRYLPYLESNSFDGNVILNQKMITFVPVFIFLSVIFLKTINNFFSHK